MDQLELFPLPSPCIGICEANNKGYCKGCLRSRWERQQWYVMSNLQRRHIIHLCYLRRRKLKQLAIQQQDNNPTLPEQLNFSF